MLGVATMRIKGTDSKAVKAMVSASDQLADYGRLYPKTAERAVEVITGVARDYAAMGIDLTIEVPDNEHVRGERLATRYGLTRSEAVLALHIAGGGSLTGYANARSVTRNTARNQLQQVFDKTGVRRQAELVRLLADF